MPPHSWARGGLAGQAAAGRAEDQSGVLVCCCIQPFAKWLHPGRADGQGFLEIFRESRYAVLCRTGVEAMTEVMTGLGAGKRVAPAGGGESLRALATVARDLKAGRRAWHPELFLFPSWGDCRTTPDMTPPAAT